MKITKSAGRVTVPKGTHLMIVTQFRDYGTVTDKFSSDKKVGVVVELPEQRIEVKGEDKPMIFERKYRATIGKDSGLRLLLEACGGDLDEVEELDADLLADYIGLKFMGTIKHTKNGQYTNEDIKSVAPLSKNDLKAYAKLEPEGLTGILDLDNFDEEFFKQLPNWVQKDIAKSPEYKENVGEPVGDEDEEEEEEEDEDDKPQRTKPKGGKPTPVKRPGAPVKSGPTKKPWKK